MKKHKINVYATDLKTDKSIYDVDYKKTKTDKAFWGVPMI